MLKRRKETFIIAVILLVIISCKGKNKQINNNTGNTNKTTPLPCESNIDFFPQELSGESPLQVTYSAKFIGKNSDGITAVLIDFGGDNFIDWEYSYEATPKESFSYNAVYSSVGEFKDIFYFLWKENEEGKIKECKAKKEVKIKVSFFCPIPSVEIISQITDSQTRSATIWLRPNNMSLEQVTFYAGYDIPQKVRCIPDNRFRNTCFISLVAPEFGDWSACWYAESFCGRKTDLSCSSFIISYQFSEIFNYAVGQAVAFSSFSDKIVAINPPYISLISSQGDVIKRIPIGSGEVRWIKLTEEGTWLLRVSDKFFISFTDFSGNGTESVITPESLYGTISFDIYKTSSKRYAIVLRSFQDSADILVFDITSLDASTPICKRIIPSGPRIIRFLGEYAFVGYIDKLYSYKIDFISEICEIREPKIYNFQIAPSVFDIEGNYSEVIGVYSSDFSQVQGKVFTFKFIPSSGTFLNLGEINASVGNNEILSLKVSPFNLSHIAISYKNKDINEYRTKIYDLSTAQSIGGIEGLKITEKPLFSSFLGGTTVAVIDEKNRINILEFPYLKKIKKIGGSDNLQMKTSQVIETNCDTGKHYMFIPDGGGIALLEITQIFSGGFPSISTYISKDTISIQKGQDNKVYGIFNNGSNLYASDTDFSFSVSLDSSNITDFSVGLTYLIVGGPNGIYYAKKNFASFSYLNFQEINQLKKSIHIYPFFFLFSGNSLLVLSDELEKILNISMVCDDISVSDDKSSIFCLNAFGVTEFTFEGMEVKQKASRSFFLPPGSIYDSDFEEGHIFFVSDLGISKGFGAIRASDLKLVILYPMEDEIKPVSISAKKYCIPGSVFVSVYGNFPGGGIAKGWIVKIR